MRKKTLIFLLAIFNMCLSQQSFTYQESNVLFSNQNTSFVLQQNKEDLNNDLTMNGYLWFDHMPKKDVTIMQLDVFSKEYDKEQFDPLYPKCILDQNLLETNQDIREYSFIKNNPNCNLKKNTAKTYIEMKLIKNEQNFLIEIYNKNERIFQSDQFIIQRQKYVFFAVSFSIIQQFMNVMIFNIQEGFKQQKNKIQIQKENYEKLQISFGRNENFDFNGGIEKFNMFKVFTDNLTNLLHVDQSIKNQIRDNLNLELIGASDSSGNINQIHHLITKVQINGKLNSKSDHILIEKNQHLFWSDQFEEITTKIFMLNANFKTQNEIINILKIEQEDLNIKISLKRIVFQYDKKLIPPDIYDLEVQIQNKQFIKKAQLKQIELNKDFLYFGFTLIQNQIQFFQFDQQFDIFQQDFLDFPISVLKPVKISMFNQDNNSIEFKSLLVLNSLTPFIFRDQSNIENCILPVMPTFNNEHCQLCQNSVLNFEKDQCYNYCPVNFKNVGNQCIPCQQKNCKEVDTTHLQIERVDNAQFEISFNHKLPFMTFQNYDKIFKIYQNKKLLKEDRDYDIQMIDEQKLKVNFNTDKTIYNDTINVQLDVQNIKDLYDENFNYISESSQQYKADIIRHLSQKEKIAVKIFVIILLAIFLLTIMIGVAIAILSCKNNINELITKKIILLIQQLQFLPFLLLFRINLPANLHYFLQLLFQYFIQPNEIFQFLKNKSPYIFSYQNPHPNFCDRQFSANYLYNFGLVFLIHFSLILVYVVLKFYKKKGRKLSFKKREFVKKVVQIFEYNLLLLMFWLFANQIFVFSTLTLENFSMANWVQILSIIISLFYLIIVIGFLSTFLSLFLRNRGFLNNHELKYKMSFLFIGQRNKKAANVYEIVKLILQMGFCICLTYFRNNSFAQLTTTLVFCFSQFIFLVAVRPYEKRKTNYLQILNDAVLVFAIFLLYMLAVRDSKNNYNLAARDRLGWIIVGLLVLSQVQSFYSMIKELKQFWKKVSNSSKLIFYQKEEYIQHEFSPMVGNKFVSEDKLNDSGYKEGNNKISSNYGNLGNLTRFGKNLKSNFCNSMKKKQRQEYVEVNISGMDSLEYSSRNSEQLEEQNSSDIFNRF